MRSTLARTRTKKVALARGFPSHCLSLPHSSPRKELRSNASRGGWRENATPLACPSPCVGFGLGLGGECGEGSGRGVSSGAAQWARADPLVLFCSAPRRRTVPTHTQPANPGTSRTLPRRNSQPAAQLACLICSSLTSSAKLSLVNPITSNSTWHVFQFEGFVLFCFVFAFRGVYALSLFGIIVITSLTSGRPVCSEGRG